MGYVGGGGAALRISRVLHRPGFRYGVDAALHPIILILLENGLVQSYRIRSNRIAPERNPINNID